jgi:AhpD family alkylhydroperoxidase
LNPFTAWPKGYQAMAALERFVESCGIERPLLELVKMRASQINGCAYCLDMHSKHARAPGETEQRLYALNAWRETPFYIPSASEQRWSGPKRSRWLPRPTLRTTCRNA